MKIGSQYNNEGIALVVVLWMLVLLTIMAGVYNASIRTETVLSAGRLQTAQSRALAEAGVWLALDEIIKPQNERSWGVDNSSHIMEFGNGKIEIRLQDQAGKIDLNQARQELLNQLLKSAGVDDSSATQLTDAILDWRDRDNLKHNSGAEDSDYLAAGLDYGAKDGPFNNVEELRRVMGMTEAIFRKIAPALTVYSHQPGVNPLFAPRIVLMAIPGVTDTSIDAFLQERGEETAPNQIVSPGMDKRFITGVKDRIFEITSTGIHNNSRVTLSVILQLKRGTKPPFMVLSWREV